MTEAVLLSTPTCPWYPRARRYLVDKGDKVKEINVAHDQQAATEMVRKSGQMGVPVIKIGENWIVCFDRPAVDLALADSGSSSDSGREVTEQRKVDQ
jgi:glutaredoxin